MTTLKNLYRKLENYKNFNDDENDQKFLDIVDKIVEFKDPESIQILFKYFDDEDRGWVLECLKGIIKSSEYLNEYNFTISFLQNLHLLMYKAKNWAVGFLYVILNVPKCLEVLKINIHLAKKEHLLELFDIIRRESKDHHKGIKELIVELEKVHF